MGHNDHGISFVYGGCHFYRRIMLSLYGYFNKIISPNTVGNNNRGRKCNLVKAVHLRVFQMIYGITPVTPVKGIGIGHKGSTPALRGKCGKHPQQGWRKKGQVPVFSKVGFYSHKIPVSNLLMVSGFQKQLSYLACHIVLAAHFHVSKIHIAHWQNLLSSWLMEYPDSIVKPFFVNNHYNL